MVLVVSYSLNVVTLEVSMLFECRVDVGVVEGFCPKIPKLLLCKMIVFCCVFVIAVNVG